MVAIIFTCISISSLEGLLVGERRNVLAPIWSGLAGFSWIGFAIANVYGVTTDYMASFTWLYFGLGSLFSILMVVALIKDVHLASEQAKQRALDPSLENEEW